MEKRKKWAALKRDGAVLFDGAMGTEIMKRLPETMGKRPEVLNLLSGEVIEAIHFDYLCAGAEVLTTNTFGANGHKLKETGYSVDSVIEAGLIAAKKARERYVQSYGERPIDIALDIGPIGALLKPSGHMAWEEAYALYQEVVVSGTKHGAELILIETQTDLLEAKCAVLAALEHSDLPVVCTMSFDKGGRTFTGTDIASMATTLEGLGIEAIGLNCSFGPREMTPLVESLLLETHLDLLIQPNAGMPEWVDGKTLYSFNPFEMGEILKDWTSKGVKAIGGCCGTTPDFMSTVYEALVAQRPFKRVVTPQTRVASYAKTVVVGNGPLLVGERINPTGKKRLKEALKNNELDYILREAVEQVEQGAHILDVNIGLPEINEATVMPYVISEIQAILDTPLQIDSVNPMALENAARVYNGKPLINSVNGKEESLATVLPIVKRYGACVLGLTLDESGIPESIEKRLEIADKILRRALELGIPKENVIIDCLTLTASAQQESVYDTLYALKAVKERLGLCTALGVSNVSFGLPNRKAVHLAFMTLALDYGLDLAIANPGQTEMVEAIDAFSVLKGYDVSAGRYIQRYANQPPVQVADKHVDLRSAVLKGLKTEALSAVRALLVDHEPLAVVDGWMIPALTEVGDLFDQGKIFLPQLIQSAEAVGVAFEWIKKVLLENDRPALNKGRLVLATVKHDVHDIGKNIVKVVLQNYGFEVLDLGKDVMPERILEVCLKEKIRLVGLSALMTTTVSTMAETVALLKQHMPDLVVVVGGAVLTETYAENMGADHYAKDPSEMVRIASRIFALG